MEEVDRGRGNVHTSVRASLAQSFFEPPVRERRIGVSTCPSHAPATRDGSEKRVNHLFSIEPSIVNFGAFAPLEVQSKIIRITNTSRSPVRFCILRPASCAFRVSFEKKSCLAPGMTQTVNVYFVPATWTLYRSSVKVIGVPLTSLDSRGAPEVSTAAPSVLHHVPLSSFPMLCSLRLPRFLNFGSVCLGATKRRTLKLPNPHPISFQFAVKVVVNNAAFSVEPLSGDVSARSTRVLTISYSPQVRATALFAVEVHVADFLSKPIHVEAMGTCCTACTSHAHRMITVVNVSKQTGVDAGSPCWCSPPQQRGLRIPVINYRETGRLCLEPKESCRSVSLERNSSSKSICVSSCKGRAENRSAKLVRTKHGLQFSSSSNCVGDECMGRGEAATRTGGGDATTSLDNNARVSPFNRRWKATMRAICSKMCKNVVLGEAPTTELKRQRLVSKRRYDAVDLLRRHSERDLFQGTGELPAEAVVVPSGWLPLKAYETCDHRDVFPSNTFLMRKESAERFARAVSALIRHTRALRRLFTLRKVLKLGSHFKVIDGDKTGTTAVSSDKPTTYEDFSKNGKAVKEIKIPIVPPQRTTYQEYFQVTSVLESLTPALLVRSKIDIADVFVSLDNYEFMSPLPPLDYEIMHLPDMESSNPAWHLVPTERRLLQTLLRPADSHSQEVKPRLAPPCDGINLPPFTFGPPIVDAAQFVGPPTIEFRPLISMPKTVETDLGYCFKKACCPQVQHENPYKQGPRLSLPCFGDAAVNTTQIKFSPQSIEGPLLAEIQGSHAVYGQQTAFPSLPYLSKAVGRIAREPNSARKGIDCHLSDTDSDNRDTVEIPVPPPEKYAPNESQEQRHTRGMTDSDTRGELHGSKQDDFIKATERLSELWERRTTERLSRLDEINETLPVELRMFT